MVSMVAQERMFCSFLMSEQEQRLALAVQTARLRLLGQVDAPVMATSQLRITPSAPNADVDESARNEVTLARPVSDRRCLLEAERASLHLRTGEGGLALW
jgi:hypothetical protein